MSEQVIPFPLVDWQIHTNHETPGSSERQKGKL